MTTKCALCAIARNEQPYLAEWAAFHLAIGFESIFIYNNDVEETSLEPLDRPSYVGRVFVKRWRSEVGLPPQVPAYDDFLATSAKDFDWVMFLDIDEFLNLKTHDSISSFVSSFDQVDAVAINWRIFGSSGHQSFSDDLVIRRFDLASLPTFSPNVHVKTIFRPGAVLGAAIHSPHFRPDAVMVNPNGTRLVTDVNAQQRVEYSVAQINHYFTKSFAEFAVKRERGRGDLEDGNREKYRTKEAFYAYDLNDEKDSSIQRFIPALQAFLTQEDIVASSSPEAVGKSPV